MKILRSAAAGSMESNDCMITVEPGEGGLDIRVESVVIRQFGAQITRAVDDVARELGVSDARLTVRDKGALECTIKARAETAILRAAKEADN